jgi:hypothetical protein
MRNAARPVWIVVCFAASVLTVLLGRHVLDYFFLFDDFALVGEASSAAWRTLFTTPLIGFFRPLPFLILRAEFQTIGWTFPLVYALDAAVIHGVNALLVGLLARELHFGRLASSCAGVLFGLSASAGEGYFWLSATFDRFCTLGVLIALICAIRCMSAEPLSRRLGWSTLGVCGSSLALLSKESAVVLPVLIVATGTVSADRRWRPLLSYAGVVSAAVAVVLVWRERLLPHLGGAYGQMPSLFANAPLAQNLRLYVRAIWHVPLPWHDASLAIGLLATAAWVMSAGSWLALAAVLAWRRPQVGAVFLVCFFVTLTPVAWVGILPGVTTPGRFLYLPSVWAALFAAACLDVSEIQNAAWRASGVIAMSVILVIQASSILYQAQIWRLASDVSRATVAEMRSYAGFQRPLYIENMPNGFIEGPYVLKDYAFLFYFGSDFHPSVRARGVSLKVVHGRPAFSGWNDNEDRRPGERSVHLRAWEAVQGP